MDKDTTLKSSAANNGDKKESVKEEDLEKCRHERDEYLDGWKRAKADFLNYKKEEVGRMEQFLKFGQESFIREFLPVLDSFDLAIEVGRKNGEDIKGLEVIYGQFEDIMKKLGLEKIRVKGGERFEASRHEAVAEIESPEAIGTVAGEVSSGYALCGKIIRPIRVNLSKGQNKEKE